MLTASARSAIYQIVHILPQHKVIVPAYTCEVVIEAVHYAKKEVVFVDIDRKTLNIEEYPLIDNDTIVIATHQYGSLSDVRTLAEECRKKGAVLIEDCAGAFGGRIGSQLVGTIGDYSVFSFSASKTVHSPTKGGFIMAKDKEKLDMIQRLPEQWGGHKLFKMKQLAKGIGFCLANNRIMTSLAYSMRRKSKSQQHEEPRMDYSYHREIYEWQAYVVLKQLEGIEERLMERRNLFAKYSNSINNIMITKPVAQWGGVFIRYAILVDERERFVSWCKENNISVGTGYQKIYCPSSCDVAHEVSKKVVYLPFGNGFSHKEIKKVIEIINTYK